MIASKIQIKNFKSIGPAGIEIPLDKVTALIGQNSSGKSNIQLALDLFRNYRKSKVTASIFHKENVEIPISVSVTYAQLTDGELKSFRRHLSPDLTLTINQEIKFSPGSKTDVDESDEDETTSGFSESKTANLVKSGIEWLDDAPTTKSAIKTLWAQPDLTVGSINFKEWSGLPLTDPPSKEALDLQIKRFWNEHWESIPREAAQANASPLGWPNKLMGNLPPVIYIPAIKKFSEEAKGTQGSPFGALLKWFIESINADIKETIQKKLDALHQEAIDLLPREPNGNDGELVTRLELINLTLNRNLPKDFGARLEITYKRPDVSEAIFGQTDVNADDGFYSAIEHKGHGLQRSAIIAIIRSYLELRSKLDSKITDLGRVIFAIEEPELFLHPTVKRSTYKLFRTIANQGDQVLYSTHDASFIDINNFNEIRVCRKEKNKATNAHETRIEYLDATRLHTVWNFLSGKKDIPLTSIRARLQNSYNPICNEGFLAQKIILVEGETELATLSDYFLAIGFDLDAEGCSLIGAGSVDLIELFYVIFTEFGIPVFIVWDGDHPGVESISEVAPDKKDDVKKKSRRNKLLAKLADISIFPEDEQFAFFKESKMGGRGIVFKDNFEGSFHTIVTDYEAIKGEATRLYGSKSKPLCARYFCEKILERGRSEGDQGKYVPEILREVISKIKSLTAAPKPVVPKVSI